MTIKKNSIIFITTTLSILLLDQITKYVVQLFMPQVKWMFLIIHYSQNTGAAFGMFKTQTLILSLISFGV